jgi:HK97 family phage major capsid protein
LANSTGLYTQNAVGLDIIAPISLADKLGITKYDNLTSTYKFNYTQGQEADVVAEGASLSGKTYTKLTDEIVPMAYGYSVPVSKQALAVTSMLQGFILDADNAINSKILATLLTAIDNDMYALVGYSGATTTAALTSAVLGKLKASVLSAMFNKPGFVMGSELYSEVENTAGVTGIKTVLQDGKINGFNAFDVMTLMKVHNTSAYSFIFGDWSRAAIGTWGSALEVLVDPFTLSASNQINLTFNRLADSTFNPYAFKVIRNGKIS